jgi:pimeloyl-ACP methyl ester carboxylesterase
MRPTLALASLLLLAAPAAAQESLPRIDPHGGDRAAPLAVVVHGINPTAGQLDPLADSLVRRGYRVLQFHYDDGQDLDRSATELGALVRTHLTSAPSPHLTVVAHSMGGLVSRRALTEGHPAGLASLGLRTRLVTVASPFGGFKSANWARFDLGIGPASHDDLGTRSRFIRHPGALGPDVVHHKLETDETGRTVLDGERRVKDDVVGPKRQRNEVIDAAAAERHVIPRGHVEVVNDGGQVSDLLASHLDRLLGPERAGNAADPSPSTQAPQLPAQPQRNGRKGISGRLGN